MQSLLTVITYKQTLFTAESLRLYGYADTLHVCVNLYITYPLDFGVGLAVDEGPEHVSAEDVLLAPDYEQRMPELCFFTIHLL